MKVSICSLFFLAFFFLSMTVGIGAVFVDAENSPYGFSSLKAPRTVEEEQRIEVYKRANKAVVYVNARVGVVDFFGAHYQEGTGSGVIVDAQKGYVVTNFHVIQSASQILVTLASGQTYATRLVGQDPGSDLALLQIKDSSDELVALEFADSEELEVGQKVFAIGNPFGLSRTLSEGIVSSLGRTIQAQDGRLIEDIIQIDAAINPGNSGGPLIDTAGRIVGINSAILSSTGNSAGIGFAVPSTQVVKAIPQLIKYGKVLRPKIGVVMEDTDFGPVFLVVEAGSPADRAGLQGARRQVRSGFVAGVITDFAGADFIVAINGKPVDSKAAVLEQVSKTEDGGDVVFTVRRGVGLRAKIRDVKVTPELG